MSVRSSLPLDICFLCLSRERKIFSLPQKCKHIFGFLTDWYPQIDARVCWECRAMLERLSRFKEQAKEAVCALERARTGLQPMDFKCLSNTCNTEIFIIDLLVYDEPNEYEIEELSDYTDESKDNCAENCSDAHVESDNYINEENELEEGLVSDIKTEDNSNGDDKSDNYINQKSELEEMLHLDVDKIEDTDNSNLNNDSDNSQIANNHDNNEDASTIIKSHSNIDTENTYQNESEQINLPIKTFAVDAPSSGKAVFNEKLKVENTWTIEKTHGLHYIQITPLQNKKPADLGILSDTVSNAAINKKRQMVMPRYRRQIIHKCDICDKVFATARQKWSHNKIHKKHFLCEQCAFRCSNKGTLMTHKLYHLDPSLRPHQCQVCNKRFAEKIKLLTHARVHTGERPFECEMCGKQFTYKENLTVHVQTKHYGKPRRDRAKRKLRQDVRLQPKITSNKSSVHGKHKNVWSLQEGIDYNVIRDAELLAYECNVCNERFSYLDAFREHYKSAQQNIPCTECNKTYKFPSSLAHHMQSVHTGERRHLCNICGMRFINKHRLQSHMSSHSNEKPFKCDECSATFKYKCGLYTHKMIHKGDKPFQCDICAARFTYKGNLIGHMKVHTKDKPFECNICSKKFPWKRNLKNHLKIH